MKIFLQKSRTLFTIILSLFLASLYNTSYGQVAIYTQNFGTVTSFPTGWTASSADWTNKTDVNSSGYTGASGGSNPQFLNNNITARTLTYSNTLSTVGYQNITLLWGARMTGPATITVTLGWSSDGSIWNNTSFTNVANDAVWDLVNNGTRIVLPAGAAGIANLRLRLSAVASASGANSSYRIDDFTVQGCINPVAAGTSTETCVGGSTGAITASATGGSTPYTYSLNAGAYQSAAIFTGLAAGIYTLNVKSNTGCIGSTTVTVNNYSTSTDDQNLISTNTWTGHAYDGMAFTNYIGHFTEAETFDEHFGGDAVCFNVVSNSVSRSVYTENFSVKYRMNSTKRGLYVADLGSDDGSRLTVDGTMLYNNWSDQAFSNKPSVLMNLNGNSSLLYEFYENAGANEVRFQNLTLILANTLSTNATQSICLGNAGSAISGDVYGVLPSGITLSGTGYQWSYSITPGGAKTFISGATAATFTPTSAAPFNAAGTYYIYRNTTLSSVNNIAPNPYAATNESNAATITVTPVPTATISYAGSPYCSSSGTATVTRTGTAGGTYTSTAGLTINASTGSAVLASSTAGTYTVTYTIAAAGGCSPYSTSTTITVTAQPFANGTYTGSPFCSNGGIVYPTGTFTGAPGTLTSTAGLSINPSSGAVDLAASTAGSYVVTYTVAASGGCAVYSNTTNIVITAMPSASISYAGSPYCIAAGTASVTRTGTTGGTYSSTAGLSINTSTGDISLSSSTYGSYTVTYSFTATGGCTAYSTSTTVVIAAIGNNLLDYTNGAHGVVCNTVTEGGAVTLTAPAGTVFISIPFASYGSPAGVCSAFTIGACHAMTSQGTAESYLLGNNTGTIVANNTVFGDPCIGTGKQLYVQAVYTQPLCSGTAPGIITGTTPTGGNGVFTYLWEQSTSSSSTGFSAAGGTNNAKDYIPGILTQTTWYRRIILSGGCSNLSTLIQVTVTPLPAATISYSGSPFCNSTGTPQTVTQTGTTGGAYTSTAGLTLNASTGTIIPSTSTAGTYTVTYTMAAGGGCTAQTATTSVTITALPAATISYGGSPFCNSTGTPQPVTQTGTIGGAYTSTAGLTINASTGAITPNTSTAGTYTVTYTMAAGGGCTAQTAATSVTITALPAATISYIGAPFCSNAGTGSVTLTGTTGGIYTSTTGLTINSSTGAITPGASTAGTYTVTYTMAATGGCSAQAVTTSVTITTLPAAAISYSGSPFCKSNGTAQAVIQTGTNGGGYSSTAGLSIDVTTGAIIPATSIAGSYTVTYTLAATGGCAAQTATTTITINPVPSATFSYPGSPYPVTGGTASVTFSGTLGGTYSATAGLTLNATTGDVILSTSTPGTYSVSYTVNASGGCSVYTVTTTITIVASTKVFTGTGNFSDPARWTGGTLPTAGENLVIDGSCTVDNNITTDNTAYGTLIIGTATARTLSWITGGTNRLNVTNLSAGAAASTLNMTNGGTLIIRETWASTNLTFTPGAGTIELQSTITLPAAYATYRNLVVNGLGTTVTFGRATTINGNVTIAAGTLAANNFSTTVKGNWINITSTTAFTAGTSTVTFNSTIAQSIGGSFATTFTNLTITNTGNIVSLNVNANITGNLSVTLGTLDLGVFTANRATGGGTISLSNNTFLKIGGTNTFPANFTTNTLGIASTVVYYGTNQTVAAKTYGHLTLSSGSGAAVKTFAATAFAIKGNLTSTLGAGSSVTFTAASILTITGNVDIGASTTFNGGSFSHNVAGNWINNGTFNGNTGTVIFSGPGKGVSGAGNQNFNNLTVSASLFTFSNESISLSGNLATISSGSFIQAAGGVLLMTGTGKTISGTGISIDNLAISGTVTTTTSFKITGNLSVSGSITASAGTITMSGASRTISGAGTKGFAGLSVSGTVTTAVNFSVSSSLDVSGSFSASAGTATFTGSSSLNGTANLFNTTINGTSLQLTSGSTLGIGNVLVIAAGTLNVTSSIPNTVNFNGTVAQSINAISFDNLVLSNGNTKTAAGPITTHRDITIATGTTFTASSYPHSIYGNWNNNGTFIAGTSTVQFLGSATAYLTGATAFNILTSNTSSASTELILNDNISAAIVNMTNGIITTGSDTITITNTRTGNGFIYGNIQRNHSFTTGVAYAFEGPNNTVNFSAVSGVNSITVTAVQSAVNDFPFGNAISRYYNITVPSGTYTATLRLHYEDDELNGNPENEMGIWRDSIQQWIPVGKTANDTVANYVEQSGLTNITSRWTCSINPTVVLWNGSISSDWNTAANWTVYVGSGSTPPLATDIVNIGGLPFTFQPTISTPVNIKNLVFSSNQPVTLTMASGGTLTSGDMQGVWYNNMLHTINTNGQTITINGDLLLSDGITGHDIDLNIGTGTVSVAGSLIHRGAAAINFSGAGTLNIHQNYDFESGTFNAGNGTVIYDGDQNQQVAHINYNNLTINKTTGLATIDSVVNVAGNLLISSGELDNNSTTIIAGNVTIDPGGTLLNNYMLHVGGNWLNTGTFVGTGAHVVFNGSGTQTISATTFNNLEINKPVGSTAVLTGNLVLNGDLTVHSGTLDIKSFSCDRIVAGGALILEDSATFIVGGNNAPFNFTTGTLAVSSTVIADGTAPQAIYGDNFGNLILRNAGLKTLVAPITVNGTLTIENGAVFDGGSQTLTLNGNWVNNGSFTPSNSTILCTGIGKTISGVTTFHRFSVYGSYTVLSNVTFDSLLTVNSGGAIYGGSNIVVTMNGDLINSGILYTLGTTTYTGHVVQTLSLINAVQTVAITVNFNGSVSPVLNSTTAPLYGFLNINNTGGVDPSVDWTVLYAMTVGSGASFNGGISTHNFQGSVTNNGTITSNGTLNFIPATAATVNLGSGFSSTGIVNFGGAGAITLAANPLSFHDVVISNTNPAGITPLSGWNVANNFTVNSGASFNAGNHNYFVGNNMENHGLVNSGTSTFSFNGTSHQTADGMIFYNLDAMNSGAGVVLLDVTVNNNLSVTTGTLSIGNNEIPRNIAVSGNITIAVGTILKVDTASNATHQLTVSGNIINIGTLNLRPDANSVCNVTFNNVGAQTISGTGVTTSFNSITVDMGVADTNHVDITATNFNAPNGFLTLKNGSFNLNSPGVSITPFTDDITTGNFLIPSTSGLWVNAGIINSTNMNWTVAGTAKVTGGTMNMGSSINNLVIPKSTAHILVNGGNFNLASAISNPGNSWSYSMNGGTMTVNTQGSNATGVAPFNMDASGSSFSMRGGILIIKDAGGSADQNLGYKNLAITGNGFTGGTLQIGNSLTTASSIFGLVSTNPIYNLTVNSGNATAILLAPVLAVSNNVTVSSGKLNIDTMTLKIGGAISNSGTFIAANGTIEMNGTAAQIIPPAAFQGNNLDGLTIDNDAGVILAGAINLKDVLTVSKGSLASGGYLTLKSSATATARVATITSLATTPISGNVMAERYVPGRRKYRLITSPVTTSTSTTLTAGQEAFSMWGNWQNSGNNASANIGNLITGGAVADGFDQGTTNASVYTYDDVNRVFKGYSTANGKNTKYTPLKAGIAYLMFVYGDRQNSVFATLPHNTVLNAFGTLKTGDQVYNTGSAIALTGVTGRFTLLGNPFASPIDWTTLTKTNLANTYWGYDPNLGNTGGYITVTTLGTVTISAPYSGSTGLNQYIQSGQGFFVKTIGASPTLTIREQDKVANFNANAYRNLTANTMPLMAINLQYSTSGINTLADGVLAVFDASFTNTPTDEDASKMANTAENLSILNKATQLSIDARKMPQANDTLFLNVQRLTRPQYNLQIFSEEMTSTGVRAYLQDNYLNTTQPLSLSDTNNITININTGIPASYDINRFRVVFRSSIVVLPLKFISISAARKEKNIEVNWTVAEQSDIKRYEIERSADGTSFSKAGEVTARASNSNENYHWLDINPMPGINYYRIRAIHSDGRFLLSNVVVVKVSAGNTAFKVFPNPVTNHQLNIRAGERARGTYSILLYNQQGQQIVKRMADHRGGMFNMVIELNKTIPAGIYYLKILNEEEESVQTIFLE